MAFHVGQKVVCVDDSLAEDGNPCGLKANALYTVRAIAPEQDCVGDYGIQVHEVACRNYVTRKAVSSGYFRSTRFRPVIERSTDTGMAILRKVAADTSDKVTVRAKAPSRAGA